MREFSAFFFFNDEIDNLRGILIKQNCYFNILEIDIEESFEIMKDTVIEYFESRLFTTYIECIDKEKFKSYEEYKSKVIVAEVEAEVFDIDDRKKEAEETLKRFAEGGI